MMKILFCELEGWERQYLDQRLPQGHNTEFIAGPISAVHSKVLEECDILSPFILTRIDEAIFSRMPRLKLIATRSTGYDHIDCERAASRGIIVANVPEYGSNTVAEHTFALLLALSRRLIPAYVRAKAGRFSTDGLRGFDLRGKTLGVIGSGNIGLHFIRMATSFGMRVIVYDLFPRHTIADVLGFEYVSFETLLSTADVISLYCPATKDNRHMIRAETIARMRKGVILLNTARGTLVNTHDLLAALESGHVAGAGLDVLEGERAIREEAEIREDVGREELVAAIETHKLLARENVIVTPHNAFNSEEAVRRILDTTAQNISEFIQTGRPACPVQTKHTVS